MELIYGNLVSSAPSMFQMGLPFHKYSHGRVSQINKRRKLEFVHCQLDIGDQKSRRQKPVAHSVVKMDYKGGIGIAEFLQGKTFFITGATGFFAKVLVEKILRSIRNSDKIYLLINASDEEAAKQRLKNEIIDTEIFYYLRKRYGRSYESFMLSKPVPVVGDICESDLGLKAEIAHKLSKEVDIIVNSAACTNFHERYDVSINTNTRGPCHMMYVAKKCPNLKLFVQISSAYVNGERKGKIMEKPFGMGDNIALENFLSGRQSSLPPLLDVESELILALNFKEVSKDNPTFGRSMKNLGLERARKYGWQDTYVFTKAMGEMMINHSRENIPVLILRPSVIESTYKEPFPGWIEGHRMLDPFITHYGKGRLQGILADPNCPVDLVPVDMVVNATLAAIAKHGISQKSNLNVYHISSSAVNPLNCGEVANFFYQHFSSNPYVDSKGNLVTVSPMKFFNSIGEYSSHLWTDVMNKSALTEMASLNIKESKRHKLVNQKRVEQIKHMASVCEPYTFYGGRFDNSNMVGLIKSMSLDEKQKFGFDMKSIDWNDYIIKVHIPGVRKHIMNAK